MSPGATLAIARTTARDALRSPVTLVVVLAGTLLTLAAPEVAVFTLGRAQAFVLDLGASTVLLALLFLAATAGALGTAERVQDGTALLVLTRTSGELDYVLGTFLGTGAVLGLGGWILGLALLHATSPGASGTGFVDLAALAGVAGLGVRASLRGGPPGPAVLTALGVLGAGDVLARFALAGLPPLAGVTVAAAALGLLAGLAYAALGVALGVRLPPALAASATLGAGILGAASAGLAGTSGSERAVTLLATFVPDLSLFSVAEAAYADRGAVSIAYVLGVAGWTALYAAGALALGAVLLSRRELGSQTTG